MLLRLGSRYKIIWNFVGPGSNKTRIMATILKLYQPTSFASVSAPLAFR